ncbi:murein hydrolase activator EnvC family protein [Dysgonomonas macrotermitis]|uniref:Septal ring factor EnvC, activator of murein hydrolases AmiA and AmiB n=1 Tax=Dysgonomonas macrotermitis TaxID=1346286 RepID=A0A1M5C7M2_9BACT|nr:peptidoglycan DD-metalloendopeptidase family protein [Dysgonomonas macrotermitis]SHF50753.1 Septal ring factor EnvC, activator of murein hydrolases AmiA and AmiB [Dysgonomonas macrotermitis]
MRTLVLSVILLFSTLSVFAQTNQIKELEKKRKLALREIENTTLLLDQTKKSTSTLLNRISMLSEQINSRQQVISLLGQEINAITKQQTITEGEIKDLEIKLKDQQKSYAKAMESVVLKKQGMNKLLFILSGKSLSESLRRMKYLKDYSDWRNQQIIDIREKQETLREKRESLQKSKADKLALLSSREIEQSNLQKEEETHKKEVDDAGKKQKELQDILSTKQKQADNLNAQIEKLIAQEVARQEREARRLAKEKARREAAAKRKAEAEAKRKAASEKSTATTTKPETKTESRTEPDKDTSVPEVEEVSTSTKVVVTKENFALSSNFAANKGKLPVPVTGTYSIVGRFGTHQHSKFRVTTNNGGIDIQAKAGAQARAVFGGEVTRVVAFPGYNNCIIVRHGGYYTFYGNIQQISVKQGQKVTAGQALGQIYTDSDTGSSQLHFQLWQGTTKLNPEPWLKR